MKAAVALASLVGLVGRCSGFDLGGGIDDPWHHHDPDHGHAGEGGHEPSDNSCDPPPSAAGADAGTPDYDCGPPGLYKDHSHQRLATGVIPYTPRYELWADGADKERFIYLPDDTQIDTSNPDRWTFPVGTRIYKTFSLNNLKLETRVLEKTKPEAGWESWTVQAYAWSQEQKTVRPASADGEPNVLGTQHDIPSAAQCKTCHAQAVAAGEPARDIVNGFEAIQLNHDAAGWTLDRLDGMARLTNGNGGQKNVSVTNAVIPGDEVTQDALGYLHANCSHCHRGDRPDFKLKFDLRVAVGLTKPSDAAAYKVASSCTQLASWTGHLSPDDHTEYKYVIEPGSSLMSAVVARMSVRAKPDATEKVGMRVADDQMPKVGTELVDEQGVEDVSAWVDQLDFLCP